MGATQTVHVDCDKGRRLGCASFCCRLLVRLDPDERVPIADGVAKGYVDKEPDGTCTHFDAARELCLDWEGRPRLCRRYDCNSDPLLQVVLRDGFEGLVQLVTADMRVPRCDWKQVPYVNDDKEPSE